jgi:hypothetical protein
MNVEGRGFMTDISLMNIGNEVRERKGDFHKIVSLRLKVRIMML